MGDKTPKQFCPIAGKPILVHAFNAFANIRNVRFTLVLNYDHIEYWRKLCLSHDFKIPHDIVVGGSTRFQSVKNGLKNIPAQSLVLIHDAARPFVSKDTIYNVINTSSEKGNAVPVVNFNDSLRQKSKIKNSFIDRNNFMAVQTPQGFHSELIKSAYKQKYNSSFTDDATVLESTGMDIYLVDGNTENIKITNPIDLVVGEGIHKHIKGK